MNRWTGLAVVSILLCQPCLASEPIDPHRPAAIESDGVTVIPESLWQRLRQYQNIRGASFQGWSPDGRGILVTTRFANSNQLHRVYEPEGRREQITFFEEPVNGRFVPRATDGKILLSMSEGGNENFQILLLDQQNFRTELLTDGKSRNLLNAIKPDGSQMIVGSNRRNGRDTDLYLADPRKSELGKMILQATGEFWTAADWSNDGSTVLLRRYVSINESYFATLNVETGERKDLKLPQDGPAAIGQLAFAADGKSIYIATDAGSEFLRLAQYAIDQGDHRWMSDDLPWDVSDLKVDDRHGTVAFAVNEDGASRLFVLKNGTRRELELPLGIVSDLDFSPDGARLGFSLARPDAPIDSYSIDLKDGKLVRWTISEVGGLNPAQFIAPRRVHFPSFDGREIPAYYFLPRQASNENPAPVVINIHGGPESQYRPQFTASTQFYLSELGVAVLHPNVRGSSGYGKTYLKLDNADKREDSVKDIGALLDWIEQQPELDRSRVAVMGGSYGGYMVLASLVHFGDRIKAGIDIVGIANYLTFLENTAAYRQDLRRAEYGDERDPKMREVFERISPANHADKIRSALMVAHGKNDPRVPFSEAVQIADKVRSSGRPVWTVYASNEGHGFQKRDNDDYLRAAIVLFLQNQLGVD